MSEAGSRLHRRTEPEAPPYARTVDEVLSPAASDAVSRSFECRGGQPSLVLRPERDRRGECPRCGSSQPCRYATR